MQKSIIYHYAAQMVDEYAGSQVHLRQMLKAFAELGYDVELVAGLPDERAAALQRLRSEIATGRQFDFLYAWSPTVPTVVPRRRFFRPLLDYRFFAWCRGRSIPLGLFYGDIMWRFDHYKQNVPRKQRAIWWPLYWWDWANYRLLFDHLFLPSLGMRQFLPTAWPADRVSALFPGCNLVQSAGLAAAPGADAGSPGPLRLFYVGGVVPPLYDLKPMVDVINAVEGVCLTLCCRPFEWERVKSHYLPFDASKIQVVHEFGPALAPYYSTSDLFGFFWRHPYLDFAMPVKLFEAIGYGLPLVAWEGTESARFIAAEGAGWVVANKDEFAALLARLRNDRDQIAQVRRHLLQEVAPRHTWRVRAQGIADTLAAYAPAPAGQPAGSGRRDRSLHG